MSRSNRPPRRTFDRLSLEHLEAREVPAAYFWRPGFGSDGLATTAGNWRTGTTALAPVHTAAPDADDDLYFQGDVSTADCTIPDLGTPSGVVYDSLNLLYGVPLTPQPGPIGSPPSPPIPTPYTGTVTVEDSITIGSLVVECGTVDQADEYWLTPPTPYAPHAGTLTITTALDWTGGTLHSGEVAGYIDLAPGAVGVAEPTDEGTVYLGSDLRLRGDVELSLSSQLTLNNGTYITTGGTFHAMAGSLLMMAPVPKPIPNDGTPSITVDNQGWKKATVQVDQGSVAIVTSDNRANSTNPVKVALKGGATQYLNRGTTTIESYTHVLLQQDEGLNDRSGYLQNKGGGQLPAITKLQAGSAIIADGPPPANGGNVHIQEGELRFFSVAGVANQPEALIEGPVNNNLNRPPTLKVGVGAKITPPLLSEYVMLKVKGDVLCEGDIELWADRTGVKRDKILATGIMTLRPGATPTALTVHWRNPGAALAAVTTKWYFLESQDAARGGITNFPNPTWPGVQLPEVLSPMNNGTSEFGMERTA